MNDYIRLLRPHQYLKNLFIFMPLFFGLRLTEFDLFFKTLLAFVSFSLIASSVYIFNDYYDIEDDKNHPLKKNRPLAAGKVSKNSAIILMISFLLTGIGISYFLNTTVTYLLLTYIFINVVYTLKLKHISIVDVFIIAIGFIIRLAVGAQCGNIPLSMWIIVITFLLALFLALAKRRDDVLIYIESGNRTRKVIDGYNLDFLNSSITVMAAVIIVAYIMYTISPDVVVKMHSNRLYLTVGFVIFGLLRYMQLTFVGEKSGSPTEIMLKDRLMQWSIIGWFLTFIVLIY